VLAVFAQVRREDLRVPAAARDDLDHRQPGLQPEERQRGGRVAVLVAGDVGRLAPVAAKDGRQVHVGRSGRRGRGLGGGGGVGGAGAEQRGQQGGKQERFHRGDPWTAGPPA